MSTLADVAIGAGTVGALVPVYMGVLEYRLKARSQRAETDARLAQLFAAIVPIADGRGGAAVPDSVVNHVLSHATDPHDAKALSREIHDFAISLPVGRSTQVAAISSIGELGRSYDILREPAQRVLNSFDWFADQQLVTARAAALMRVDR
jgi:hypothetical protein